MDITHEANGTASDLVRILLIVTGIGAATGLATMAVSSIATPGIDTYPPPALQGYLLTGEYDDDGNGDGIKETRVRHYRNPAGDQLFNMTTGGVLWAWSLNRHGDDDADVSRNYVIRDSDCDGRFDERYRLDQEFHVPACVL